MNSKTKKLKSHKLKKTNTLINIFQNKLKLHNYYITFLVICQYFKLKYS